MADEKLTPEDLEVRDSETEEDYVEEDDVETEETGEEEGATPASTADLEAKIAELERGNAGLVKSLTEQRSMRQELQTQLNGIRDALTEFRQSATKETKQETAAEVEQAIADQISIDFDDKGNPYLDTSKLKLSIPKPDTTKVERLEAEIAQLKQTTGEAIAQAQEEEQLNSILDQNEGYPEAFKKVTKAWTWLRDEAFDALLVKKGLNVPTTADGAIEIALGSKTLQADFAKKFPGVDMESTMEAHLINTPRYLKKALNAALSEPETQPQRLDTSRPSLANVNSSGGSDDESLLNRVADMDPEDFNKLDPKTLAKIDKLLEAQG